MEGGEASQPATAEGTVSAVVDVAIHIGGMIKGAGGMRLTALAWCLNSEDEAGSTSGNAAGALQRTTPALHASCGAVSAPMDLIFMLQQLQERYQCSLGHFIVSRALLPAQFQAALTAAAASEGGRVEVVKGSSFAVLPVDSGPQSDPLITLSSMGLPAGVLSAASALLRHCEGLPGLGSQRFHLENFGEHMMFGQETLVSLQVLSRPGELAGISLLALLDRTRSSEGRSVLVQWATQPLTDPAAIAVRQACIQAATNLLRVDPTKVGRVVGALKSIRSTRNLLQRVRVAKATHSDWARLTGCLAALRALHQELKAWGQLPELADASPVWTMAPGVVEAASLLTRYVQPEAGGEEGESCIVHVMAGADDALDQLRLQLERAPVTLQQATAAEWPALAEALAGHPDSVQSGGLAHHPNLGVVWHLNILPGMGDSLQPAIPSLLGHRQGRVCFYSQDRLVLQDAVTDAITEVIGPLPAKVRARQLELHRALESMLLSHEGVILDAVEVAGEVDVALALAAVSSESAYTPPTVQPSGQVWQATDSRHPLQELLVEQFVPNSLALGRTSGQSPGAAVTLITGPNSSGKSVLMKQVGLLQIMAQMGCPIPADAAAVPVVDRLLTRLQSREQVLGGASSFTADLQQMLAMVMHATKRSMLLIDEFGKGTMYEDGVALLAATLRHMLACGGESQPIIIVTTHYTELASLLQPDGGVQCFHMQGVLEDQSGTHVPVFQLAPGTSSSSLALQCAQQAGVPAPITQRAKEILGCIRYGSGSQGAAALPALKKLLAVVRGQSTADATLQAATALQSALVSHGVLSSQ